MATPKVYVICDQNCKYESMTKEQIITAILQAVESGTIGNIDAGFVQTIKTINGHALKFFVGEQSEYDALNEVDKADLFAIITNDTTREGLLNAITTLQTDFTELKNGLTNGSIIVKTAESLNSGGIELNNDKKLTGKGYYYIMVTTTGMALYNFGLVYWNGASEVYIPAIFIPTNGTYSRQTFNLKINSDGSMTLYNCSTFLNGDAEYSDITSENNFYTAKIALI